MRFLAFTLITILLLAATSLAQEECNNPFQTNKDILLQTPEIQPKISKYCNFLKYGSCCKESYTVQNISKSFEEKKTSLYANYTLMVNHYAAMISKIKTFDEKTFEKLYTYALRYTKTDEHTPGNFIFHKIDTKAEFIKLANKIYSDLTGNFETCSETLLSHLAGQMCLYCDPSFIQGFQYNAAGQIEVQFSYNVCYQFQRKCFKYIDARILIAGLKNLVLMLDELYKMENLITLYETVKDFRSEEQFATRIRKVMTDEISIPPMCFSEFQCPWACENLVKADGLDISKIVNPTEVINYHYEQALFLPTTRLLQTNIIVQSQNDEFVWSTTGTNSITFGQSFSGLDWRKQDLSLVKPDMGTTNGWNLTANLLMMISVIIGFLF